MAIVRVTSKNARFWAELCNELWPHNSIDEMLGAVGNGEYMNEYLYETDGMPVAFLSLSIRHDYVEGKMDSNPVGYIEGIYMKPEHRKKGIAKELVQFSRKWSIEHGCTMIASDCELTNEDSRLFHKRIGFVEVNINIHFTMNLTI